MLVIIDFWIPVCIRIGEEEIYIFNIFCFFFRTDSESREKGGQIPFLEVDGFNAGEYFEDYQSFLNPDFHALIPRPQRPCAKFKIHSNKVKIYYEKSKCGENQVAKMMPLLSQILGVPRITNSQFRPTSIRMMKRAKIDDRTIMELTGHKKIATLNNYDPNVDNARKIDRSFAIMGVPQGASSRTPVSCTLTSAQVQAGDRSLVTASISTSLSNLR